MENIHFWFLVNKHQENTFKGNIVHHWIWKKSKQEQYISSFNDPSLKNCLVERHRKSLFFEILLVFKQLPELWKCLNSLVILNSMSCKRCLEFYLKTMSFFIMSYIIFTPSFVVPPSISPISDWNSTFS